MERTTADGVWRSDDDGVTWALVEPSQAFLDWRSERERQQAKLSEPAPELDTVEDDPPT